MTAITQATTGTIGIAHPKIRQKKVRSLSEGAKTIALRKKFYFLLLPSHENLLFFLSGMLVTALQPSSSSLVLSALSLTPLLSPLPP
jgi:hypothetical protein